jgi:hypothetical protein
VDYPIIALGIITKNKNKIKITLGNITNNNLKWLKIV